MSFSFSAASITRLARSVNRPSITIAAVVVALVLGGMRAPFLQYLRPIGDFYVALLQMCVLPFLLTTIPLAVRAAMNSGTAGDVARSLVIWTLLAIVAIALAAILVPEAIFHFLAVDETTLARIGALVGSSAEKIDVTFALDPRHGAAVTAIADRGLLSMIPTNIFASLSGNDSMRVLVFTAIFGVGMVLTESESEQSLFSSLRHIQSVCILIFDCFSLLVPVGIVALIAPQVALMGPDIYSVLAMFAYAFLGVCVVVLAGSMAVISMCLQVPMRVVLAVMLKPMMLGASTRNTLVCIPLALETMKAGLGATSGPCDMFIPVGFATLRFGTILYFIIATLFMGTLMGRSFGALDLLMIAILATGASFATLGVTGLAALAPLAAVLLPFGLSYELAVPLIVIIDPVANMVRVMVNIAVNCAIPVLVGGRRAAIGMARAA